MAECYIKTFTELTNSEFRFFLEHLTITNNKLIIKLIICAKNSKEISVTLSLIQVITNY